MPDRPQRRTIRYDGYDYSLAGYYALTICAADKACLFGHLPAPETEAADVPPLVLSALGELVRAELLALSSHFPATRLDEWVLMPNHLHLVVVVCKNQQVSVAQVVGALKSRVFRGWRQHCLAAGQLAPPSPWQRNYYERIVRDAAELDGHRQYLRQNPTRWHRR